MVGAERDSAADTRPSGSRFALTQRSYRIGVTIVAGLSALIAVAPLVQGTIPSPGDDSVYYSAAALLLRGTLPYRDFALLHPPGIGIVLAPFAALGEATNHRTGFEIAHWFFALVVTPVNTLLVAALARRWKGAGAGLLAAMFLVVLTQTAVWGGRLMEGTLLLLCLAGVLILLGRHPASATARLLLGGAVLGAACSIKLWAGVYVVAALLLPDVRRSARRVAALLAGWVGAMLVLVVPFAVSAPAAFVNQVIKTQASRPAEGVGSLSERIVRIYAYGPLGLSASTLRWAGPIAVLLLGVATVAIIWALREGGANGPFWATVSGLTTVMLLVSPIFFKHYPTFVGPPVSILFAAASIALVSAARRRSPALRLVIVGGLAVLVTGSFVRVLRDVVPTVTVRPAFASSPWNIPVPENSCVYSEVAWLALYSDRLPPVSPSRYWAVDPGGGALADAIADGGTFESAAKAAEAPAVQREIRRQMNSCGFIFTVSSIQAEAVGQNAKEFERTHELVWRDGDARLWRQRESPRS